MVGSAQGPRRDGPTLFVGIGSNLDPAAHILKGVSLLSSRLHINGTSRFYRNDAVHPRPRSAPQPAFLNGVIRAWTALPPEEVKFHVLREVENACGRLRTGDRYAPRTLDLDLLMYGDLEIRTDALQLPDPGILVHPFLAVPLAELAPELVPPGSDCSMREMVRRMNVETLLEDAALTRAVRLRVSRGVGNA